MEWAHRPLFANPDLNKVGIVESLRKNLGLLCQEDPGHLGRVGTVSISSCVESRRGRDVRGSWGGESAGCWPLKHCWRRRLGKTEQPLPGISALGSGQERVGSWRWWLPVAYPRRVPLLCPSQHLQQHESGVEGESCYYHCVLCNYSTKAKLNLIQHVRSMKHQRSESLRKLQRLQKGLPEEDEDLGQIFTIRRCPSTDPGEWSHGPVGEWFLVGARCGPPEGFGLLLLVLVSHHRPHS